VSEGRGRPPALPHDASPFDAPVVDVGSRVAWLLRSNRLRHHDRELRSQTTFAARLRARGLTADAARVSTWENGRASVPKPVLIAYAQELELPYGALRAAHSALRRVLVVPSSHPSGGRAASASAAQARLDAVYPRIGHTPSGGDWLDLSELMAGDAGVVLPTSLMEELVTRLLRETMRGVGAAYTTRIDALTRLITTPRLTALVTRCTNAVVQEPGAQGVADLVALLGEVRDVETTRQLLRHLREGSRTVRVGATHALLNLVATGLLPPGEIDSLERTLRELAVAEPDGDGAAIRQLIGSRLYRSSGSATTGSSRSRTGRPAGRAGHHPRRHHPSDERDACREALARFEAASLERGLPADAMYLRLAQKALTSRFTERQRHAGLLLMMSPHREAAAEGALGIATRDVHPAVRSRALALLTYVATPAQAPALTSWLGAPDRERRRTALIALSHAGAVPLSADLDRIGRDDPALAGATSYAAGMSGHPVLQVWASDGSASSWRRTTAKWWLRTGPAVQG
jgi:hypothetical protein